MRLSELKSQNEQICFFQETSKNLRKSADPNPYTRKLKVDP